MPAASRKAASSPGRITIATSWAPAATASSTMIWSAASCVPSRSTSRWSGKWRSSRLAAVMTARVIFMGAAKLGCYTPPATVSIQSAKMG